MADAQATTADETRRAHAAAIHAASVADYLASGTGLAPTALAHRAPRQDAQVSRLHEDSYFRRPLNGAETVSVKKHMLDRGFEAVRKVTGGTLWRHADGTTAETRTRTDGDSDTTFWSAL